MEELSEDGNNSKTKVRASQLYAVCTTPVYIISIQKMAIYAAKLQPVCNILQNVNIDVNSVNQHIISLIEIFESHRNNAEEEFSALFENVQEIAEELKVEIKPPRTCGKQTNRANYEFTTTEEYFRRRLFIPYLDSLIFVKLIIFLYLLIICMYIFKNKFYFMLIV